MNIDKDTFYVTVLVDAYKHAVSALQRIGRLNNQ